MTIDHSTNSDCWCKPEFQLPCVICLGDEAGCEACNKGWTLVDRETFDASEMPGICVHRKVENSK